MITSYLNKLSVPADVMGTAAELEVLQLALGSYGHLLRTVAESKCCYGGFAAKIEKAYDCTEPRNAEIVRVLRVLDQQNPAKTYYIVPAVGVLAGQSRIVACVGDIANARDHYRTWPEQWREVGLMNYQGKLVCLDAPRSVAQEFKDCEPLAAGLQLVA